MNAKTETLIRSAMTENPYEALKNWQYITNSYSHSFISMTFEEMRLKTQEANVLLESQKSHIAADDYNKLKETLKTNPQEVLQHFRMVQMQSDLNCASDIRKFTTLAKEYANLPSYLCNENNQIAKQLKELSNRYLKDEKFNQAIASNELTKAVQKSLSEMAESKELKINEVYRGFER